MIFRIEKTKDYTVMSNYHLREKEMSLKAKGLLSWMLSNNDDWDYSIAGIVANCKENETAIKSALDELQKFGYLQINKLMPESKIINGEKVTIRNQIEYEYVIFEKPQDIDFQDIDFLCVENQPQRNTKISNTNKVSNNISKDILLQENVLNDVSDKLYSNSKPKKKNLYEKCLDVISEYTDNLELQDLLVTYLKMRLEVRDKPLYVNMWRGMLKKLFSMSDIHNVVQQSIDKGWLAFYEVKSYGKKKDSQIVSSEFGVVTCKKSEDEEVINVGF